MAACQSGWVRRTVSVCARAPNVSLDSIHLCQHSLRPQQPPVLLHQEPVGGYWPSPAHCPLWSRDADGICPSPEAFFQIPCDYPKSALNQTGSLVALKQGCIKYQCVYTARRAACLCICGCESTPSEMVSSLIVTCSLVI